MHIRAANVAQSHSKPSVHRARKVPLHGNFSPSPKQIRSQEVLRGAPQSLISARRTLEFQGKGLPASPVIYASNIMDHHTAIAVTLDDNHHELELSQCRKSSSAVGQRRPCNLDTCLQLEHHLNHDAVSRHRQQIRL